LTGDWSPVRESAHAKLNLSLRVLGRRQDGYHLLDSIVVFTELSDTVELRPGEPLALDTDGPFAASIPSLDENLVLSAARELGKAFDRRPEIAFGLFKQLPVAAGIGGGSADAAAALRLLADLWSIPLDDPKLHAVAVQLGADVPACLLSHRCHMMGVGERIEPLMPEIPSPVVLVNPGIELSTAEVFRCLELPAQSSHVPDSAILTNDLLAPALALAPEIAQVLSTLKSTQGCRTAAMSGSGPTCFALYDTDGDASDAATHLTREHPSWWVAATRLLN